jgi:hypothetical protein
MEVIANHEDTMTDDRIQQAIELMTRFAERTGDGKRYLWTDAFAVMAYLSLALATRDQQFIDIARALIDQVHGVLGRHRPDAARSGWISGRSESDGAAHPTAGGRTSERNGTGTGSTSTI